MSIRFTIVYVSLGVVFVTLVALVAGPMWGLRIDYEKGQRLQLIQVIIPIFLTYLSTAIAYATLGRPFPEPQGERGRLLRLITAGAFIIFVVVMIVATVVYYESANGTLLYGRLDFDGYSTLIALMMGFLGITTSAISMFIFSARP
jgi:hypothetical protein